jgi:hypothetical protein
MPKISAVNRLNEDCWSVVLSFLPGSQRWLAALVNKEIYKSLWGSFTGQNIDLACTRVTDAGLVHLTNVKGIYLNGTGVTDAGLAHLTNVKVIDLSHTIVTDAGLVHLENVEEIDLTCTRVTDTGLAHLTNAKEINLSFCRNITNAAKQMLRERGVNVWRRPRGGRFIHFGNDFDFESSIFIDTTPNI